MILPSQQESIFKLDQTENVTTRIDCREVFVISIQDPVVAFGCAWKVQFQLSRIGRIFALGIATDFLEITAKVANVSHVDAGFISKCVSSTNAASISRLEKTGNALNLVPVTSVLGNQTIFKEIYKTISS